MGAVVVEMAVAVLVAVDVPNAAVAAVVRDAPKVKAMAVNATVADAVAGTMVAVAEEEEEEVVVAEIAAAIARVGPPIRVPHRLKI